MCRISYPCHLGRALSSRDPQARHAWQTVDPRRDARIPAPVRQPRHASRSLRPNDKRPRGARASSMESWINQNSAQSFTSGSGLRWAEAMGLAETMGLAGFAMLGRAFAMGLPKGLVTGLGAKRWAGDAA